MTETVRSTPEERREAPGDVDLNDPEPGDMQIETTVTEESLGTVGGWEGVIPDAEPKADKSDPFR